MKVLDTDTLTLLLMGQTKVVERRMRETDEIVISLATRIEIFQGRFATVLKAADGAALKRGQERLEQTERDLRPFPVLPIDDAAAFEFDRLRVVKGLRRIGRCDLLIAVTALANRATVVTRNIKHFRLVPGLKVENWAD